jgi:hypothetical protein
MDVETEGRPNKLKLLAKKDPALARAHAPEQQPPEHALKLCNPALTAHLASTTFAAHRSIALQLEVEAPKVRAFLVLYVALQAIGRAVPRYEDAERMITWYGNQDLFDRDHRPTNLLEVLSCLHSIFAANISKGLGLPQSELDDLISGFTLEHSAESWSKLRSYLVVHTPPPPGSEDSADITEHAGSADPAEMTSSPASSPSKPSPSKQKATQKRKTSNQIKNEKARKAAKLKAEEYHPRDADLFATLQLLLAAEDPVQIYFNFLSFRNRATQMLNKIANLCSLNGFTDYRSEGRPEEAAKYVKVFLKVLRDKPLVGEPIAEEVVKEMRGLIEGFGSMETDLAIELSKQG